LFDLIVNFAYFAVLTVHFSKNLLQIHFLCDKIWYAYPKVGKIIFMKGKVS